MKRWTNLSSFFILVEFVMHIDGYLHAENSVCITILVFMLNLGNHDRICSAKKAAGNYASSSASSSICSALILIFTSVPLSISVLYFIPYSEP